VRPVIGISAYLESARWGVWEQPAVLVPASYVTKVAAAGGLPLVVPPASATDPKVLDLLDGLVLVGGADLDPALYGEAALDTTTGLRPDRDAGELALLSGAGQRDLATLGICRGMQLLTVAAGGRLEQHLPDVVGHERHRPAPGVFGEHPVRLAAGSTVAQILGTEATVRSYHHQGIADPGRLAITGWADDATIEVVEDPQRRFCIGVLWHPEVGDDPRLFEALVAAARSSRART
jgi:putative glutamine amidotransferase